MEGIALPTFTIPTYKCCSLILTFDDIEAILGSEKPRLVQVGIGEIESSRHLFDDLKVNWLFSPNSWPVYASGFNPGIPAAQQSFLFDVVEKKIQFSNSTARTSMTYPEIAGLVSRTDNPKVSIVSMPLEEVEGDDASGKGSKSKRKIARRLQAVTESMNVIQSREDLLFVVPLIGQEVPPSGILGVTGPPHRVEADRSERLRFIQFRKSEDLVTTWNEIKSMLASKSGDIFETDFPFNSAKNGYVINEHFELEDLKTPETFNNNNHLLLSLGDESPECVLQAASHTKSYIHHLFRCDELSGPILLATVNLFQFNKLFQQYAR